MSHPIVSIAVGAVAGASVLAAAVVDYNYPPPTDFTGMSLLITAIGGVIVLAGGQVMGLIKQAQTHNLVNSMSAEKLREAKEAAFAAGKLAGALEESAAQGKLLQAAQMPQIPVPPG